MYKYIVFNLVFKHSFPIGPKNYVRNIVDSKRGFPAQGCHSGKLAQFTHIWTEMAQFDPLQIIKNVGFYSKTHMVEFPCSNPYKTCRILIISEPKTQNGLQNDQKALGFH